MTMSPLSRLVRFWESEWSLSLLLFFLVAGVFIVYPLSELWARRWLTDLVSSLILVSGVWAVSRRRGMTVIVAAAVIVGLILRWASYFTTAAQVAVADTVFTLIALLLMAAVVTAKVFERGPITLHRVQGAIVVYLLLGLAWSRAYTLIEMLVPGAFQLGAVTGGRLGSRLVYYSFVTLTTVGYGDITAVHPVARSLSMMEALFGQLFPAILIARLVAMELAQSKRLKSKE